MKVPIRDTIKQEWKYLNDRNAFNPEVWTLQGTTDHKSAKGEDLLVLHLFDEETEKKMDVCFFPKYGGALSAEWGEESSNWPVGGRIRFVWLGTRMSPVPAGQTVITEMVK